MNVDPDPVAPAATIRYYWEDFPVGQVREFGHHAVSREAVLAFAREFDPQPFHLDDEAARHSLFGKLAASGWHTSAMAMRMICDGYLLESAGLGAPGVDSLAWPRPVFPGDVLRMRATVLAARVLASRPGVGLVRSRFEVLNQSDEIVLRMESSGFLRLRPAAASAAPA